MIYARAFSEGLKPDPQLKVSEWADEYRVLAPTAASEPGKWRKRERIVYIEYDVIFWLSSALCVRGATQGCRIPPTAAQNKETTATRRRRLTWEKEIVAVTPLIGFISKQTAAAFVPYVPTQHFTKTFQSHRPTKTNQTGPLRSNPHRLRRNASLSIFSRVTDKPTQLKPDRSS